VTHLVVPGPAGRRRWLVLAAVLALASVLCLLMWAVRSDRGSPVAPTPSAVSAEGLGPSTDGEVEETPAPTSAPLAEPVVLRIPRIDVDTRLIGLGLREDGTVEVPDDAAVAGWFRRGPPPGSPGSSVVLGHVDSLAGPAVFYRLRELRPGDRLSVRLEDGALVRFRVHSVRTYPNDDFPAQKVYGRQGRSQLNLVTCGGDYDASKGGYQANVVVNARPV
jgi:sortase (surface protein transpeptidase)